MDTGLGPMELYHVGIAVRDLNDGMARFGELLGIDTWVRFDADLPSVYRGEPVVAKGLAAYGKAGATFVELVQPAGGRWTAQAFLADRGEGLYHLGYWVDDVPGALRRAEAAGIGVDWRAEADGKPFVAYLEASSTHGVHLELVSSALRPFISSKLAAGGVQA